MKRNDEIQRILTRVREETKQDKKVIKKLQIFDFNYVPGKIFLRGEGELIVTNIVKFDELGTPFNLFIYGSRGSGKTVLLKYIQKTLGSKIETPMRYINCRFSNTSSKILSELTGRPSRGLGANELFSTLTETCNKMVIILDEVDLLSDRDKNQNILYFLSRSEKKYMVILLSNNPHFYNRIDPRASTTLQLEKLHFRNYNAFEIYKILVQRCKEGLKKYNIADIRKIAALTAKESNGDVRTALKTLQYLVTKKYAQIEASFQKAREDIFVDLLANQNDAVIIILRAAQKSESKLVKEVYGVYLELCETVKERPFSYMHFYNNLAYAQSTGLILLVSTRVHRGTSNSIELMFDERILNSIFNVRF